MLRLVLFLLGVLALAAGLSWLADRPGSLLINWQGYEIETSVFRAVVIFSILVGLAMLAWSVAHQVWSSPAAVSHFLTRRRHRRGLDALSSGMIAIGAGDRSMATRYAVQARRSLPNEPLTHLLRAQAAQLSGDKATARRIFEAMLAAPDTEQLGLRGLYLEASREGEREAQRQFAERALRLNPKLSWPVEALFDLQVRASDWPAALETLAVARRQHHLQRPDADRRRAVVLAAQAQALEDHDAEKAQALALEAHGLAPDLIPAAAIAGRLLAAKGNTARAAKVLRKTWAITPHPELAVAYAYARIGDSPRDRLDRVKQLAALQPYSVESAIAVATAAIDAHDYEEARSALAPHLEENLTRRVATLMAKIEGEDLGDKGRVREWLARAGTARRDPAWTADGAVTERWVAVAPGTGNFDCCTWRVPVDDLGEPAGELARDEIDRLIALGDAVEADRIVPVSARVTESAEPAPASATAAAPEPAAPAKEPPAPAAAQAQSEPEPDGKADKDPVPETPTPTAPSAKNAAADDAPKRAALTDRRGVGDGTRASGATSPGKIHARGPKAEPRVFVSPRAPDDPGTDADDQPDMDDPALRPHRA